MNKTIGVLGAGTWGIALARMLSNSGHRVTVWSAIEREAVLRYLDRCLFSLKPSSL
jgi:glycerol-3-phosphate dehydrogenase